MDFLPNENVGFIRETIFGAPVTDYWFEYGRYFDVRAAGRTTPLIANIGLGAARAIS